MNYRGQYGYASQQPRCTAVGVGALYHSVHDRAAAIQQMDIEWNALYQDFASQAGELTADPKSSGGFHFTTQRERDANPPNPKRVFWWKSFGKPIIDKWVAFKREQLGDQTFADGYIAWAARWQTSWIEYERWKKILDFLRSDGQNWGFTVNAPAPADLLMSGWSRSVQGTGGVGVGAVYHSVGDRAAAVKQLAIDWSAIYQDLASQVGELTPDPKSSGGYHVTTQKEWDVSPPDTKKVLWWKSYAKPLINTWVAFKREQLGDHTFANAYLAFAERWQTDWDVYEGWKSKLDALRAEALKRGFSVNAPVPTELPTTVWTDVSKGAKDVAKGAGDVWTFVKYGAWAVLGLGAVVALSSVAQNLRAGKDPAARYMEAIRRRGSVVARAALPPPVRLALPPGDSREDS